MYLLYNYLLCLTATKMSGSKEAAELQHIRPPSTDQNARDLVQCLYGLNVTYSKELDSYYDRNYHVKVESAHDNPHISKLCADGYVLKILNAKNSKESRAHVGKNYCRSTT